MLKFSLCFIEISSWCKIMDFSVTGCEDFELLSGGEKKHLIGHIKRLYSRKLKSINISSKIRKKCLKNN